MQLDSGSRHFVLGNRYSVCSLGFSNLYSYVLTRKRNTTNVVRRSYQENKLGWL
ncbi:hypothetical protein HanIR_Chr03g0142781 [Helianthus annuus]|nr:hypothetical protein HanIR_Chr03g0142781 [Helianthus annuus]